MDATKTELMNESDTAKTFQEIGQVAIGELMATSLTETPDCFEFVVPTHIAPRPGLDRITFRRMKSPSEHVRLWERIG